MGKSVSKKSISLPKKDIINHLWRKGQLRWLLLPHQMSIYEKVRQAMEDGKLKYVLNCSRRFGKALALDTEIPTPSGWTTMGDISEGDYVLGADGKPALVTHATPVQYNRKCYIVEFQTGEKIVADADHMWEVQDKHGYPRGKVKVMSTQEMVDRGVHIKSKNTNHESKFAIKTTQPLSLPTQNLPVDPYVLGAWLGDGTSCNGNMTIHEDDFQIIDEMSEHYDVRHITGDRRNEKVKTVVFNELNMQLKNLGVRNNKHIPIEYLRGSYEQRLAVLQGLMDTDGTVSKYAKNCELTLTNKQLSDDAFELISSLGIRATQKTYNIKGKLPHTRYTITFTCFSDTLQPFRLNRKAEMIQTTPRTNSKNKVWKRGIRSITSTDSVPVKCIQVESPGNLYLVGKSFIPTHNTSVLVLVALETALRDKNRQIRFASQTAKELRKAVHPIMQIFLETCPPDCKPRWNSQDGSYKFPNGSELHIAGVNNGHEDDLRGSNSHLNIVDEAGMIDNLKYLVQSVLIPQTLTTDAITILASTPAESPDHDYKFYYDEAMVNNSLSEFTIYDNTSLTPDKIEQIKKDNGGDNSTDWQREYLIKWVVSEDLDIIREWDDKYIQIVEPDNYYSFYHKYTVMDLGVMDLTAILYGYYDFRQAKLIIQSEDIINGPDMTTEKVSNLVKAKETRLWGPEGEVYKRVADNNNPLMLQDLSQVYGLYFAPTLKDSLDAMVNEVRLFVQQGRLIVHPSCKQLIGCLKYGIWDRKQGNKREFGRSAAYGHYDALASLVYMIRNLDQHTNPIPATLNMSINDYHISSDFGKEQQEDIAALQKAFKVTRK